MDVLTGSDREFLAALAAGESAAGYARSHSYSLPWAKWKSREVRRKLGVSTIGEAVAAMAEINEGVSRADFDKLTKLVNGLGEAVEDLARARPSEQPAAQQQVQERQLDLKDHAKARGLSLADVERLKEEKDYERFKTFLDRYEHEEPEEEPENGATSLGDKIRDGLGGIRNVKQPQP